MRSHAFFKRSLHSVHPHAKRQAAGTQISHIRAVSALVHKPFHIADIDRVFDLELDRICFLNSIYRRGSYGSSVIIVRISLRHSHLCLLIRCNSCYFRHHKVFSVQQLIGILSPRRLKSCQGDAIDLDVRYRHGGIRILLAVLHPCAYKCTCIRGFLRDRRDAECMGISHSPIQNVLSQRSRTAACISESALCIVHCQDRIFCLFNLIRVSVAVVDPVDLRRVIMKHAHLHCIRRGNHDTLSCRPVCERCPPDIRPVSVLLRTGIFRRF